MYKVHSFSKVFPHISTPSYKIPSLPISALTLRTDTLWDWDLTFYGNSANLIMRALNWYSTTWVLWLPERRFPSKAHLETFRLFMHICIWEIVSLGSLFSICHVSWDNRNWLILSLKPFFFIVNLSRNARRKQLASLFFLFFLINY